MSVKISSCFWVSRSLEQRELFKKLITVSGIGPKGALAILASGIPSQVIGAIEREDETFLVQFPGVGKRQHVK